jgi:cytochrome c5
MSFAAVLFTVSVTRGSHPDLVVQGQQVLDPIWGGLGVVLLTLGSAMMGLALLCTRSRQSEAMCLFLGLTLVCGMAYLAIRYIEGATMFPGVSVRTVALSSEFDGGRINAGNALAGRELYMRSCMACHGPGATGVPGLGKTLIASPFVDGQSDAQLVAFLKNGRDVDDPANTTGVAMPARGGNPNLSDQDLTDIVAHLRAAKTSGPSIGRGKERATAKSESGSADIDPLAMPYTQPFSRLYLLLTSLQSLFVLGSMAMIAWSLSVALRRRLAGFSSGAVTFGSLYWHATTAAAVLVYPLLYLIH